MNFIMALLYRHLTVARSDAKLILIRVLVQPAVYLFVFGHVIGRLMPTSQGGYGSIMAPGIVAIAVVSAPFVTLGGYILAGCFFRTLEEWLLSPVSLRTVMAAMLTCGLYSSVVNSMMVVGLIWLIMGLVPQNLPLLFLVLGCGGLLFSLIIMIVLLAPERPDKGQEIVTLLMMLMAFFGCTFYSYDMLETPFRWLALLLPTTYISEGLRAAYAPDIPHLDLSWVLTGLILSILVLLPLADFAFRRRLGHFTW